MQCTELKPRLMSMDEPFLSDHVPTKVAHFKIIKLGQIAVFSDVKKQKCESAKTMLKSNLWLICVRDWIPVLESLAPAQSVLRASEDQLSRRLGSSYTQQCTGAVWLSDMYETPVFVENHTQRPTNQRHLSSECRIPQFQLSGLSATENHARHPVQGHV